MLAAVSALRAAKSGLGVIACRFEEKPKEPLLHRLWPSSRGCLTENHLWLRALCTSALPFFLSPALTTSPHHTVYDLLKLFTFPLVRTHRGFHVLQSFVLDIFLQNFYLTQPIMKAFFCVWRSTRGSIPDRLPPLWLLFASLTPWVLDFKFHWRWKWTAILIWT